MTASNDAMLVQQCLEGDSQAFTAIVDRYQKTIFNLALRVISNAEDAEDVTQSVFIKAYENLASFDPKYKFFSWLYRMAINESLNVRNQRKRFDNVDNDHVSRDNTPEQDFEERETSQQVETALLHLEPEQKALIVLKHFQHLAYQEISEIMGIPEKTVKSRLYSARQDLKSILLKKGFAANDRI